jgi:hypothetical protein
VYEEYREYLGLHRDAAQGDDWGLEGKSWFHSKTLWANLIGIVAITVQKYTGFLIDAEFQLLLLAVINIIIRKYTRQPIKVENLVVIAKNIITRRPRTPGGPPTPPAVPPAR